MAIDFSAILFWRIPSSVGLLFIILVALVLAIVIIHQAQSLTKLQKPLPLYVKTYDISR